MNPVSTVTELFCNILKNEILKGFQIVFASISAGLKMYKTVQDRSSI